MLVNKIYEGDVLEVLKNWPGRFVNCVVTSPPYWGLRDYGVAGQIGLESTPEEFIEKMVLLFREIRRVLKDDGTLWLNMGDCYSNHAPGGCQGKNGQRHDRRLTAQVMKKTGKGLKPKDLIGIPWMLAFALRADGWYLRSDIIWHKPNPLPESVIDRPTKSHEYIFLFSKSPRYYYDIDAIREPLKDASIERLSQPNLENQIGSDRAHAGKKTNGRMKAVYKGGSFHDHTDELTQGQRIALKMNHPMGANKRTVWSVPTNPYKKAHFATFPPDLITPCILAGCPRGGVCLDPFMGSGTTASVARDLLRNYIGIELNPAYVKLAEDRLSQMTIMEQLSNDL